MVFPFDAVIFDFDGTIVDTETPEVEVTRAIFNDYGHEFPDAVWKDHIGRGAEQISETPAAMLARLTGRELEGIKHERDRRFHDVVFAEGLRPGIARLIADLSVYSIPKAVASSSKRDWVTRHLTGRGLGDTFGVVCCAEDVEHAKPFPDLYLLACEKLNVQPSRAVALEDSPNGIRAAKAAGLTVIAIPNPLTQQLDLSQADEIWASAELAQRWFNR
jgi:beta-phosphoglucomutase-like phosphatase (HAD superfamily)